MRLTRAGEYGVRCMLYLASLGTGELAMRKEIARAMEIPDQFLGKIAQQLSRAGFIDIVQGAKGGYRLVVPPQKLTLLDVVEAVVGEIFLNDCVMRPASPMPVRHARAHCSWVCSGTWLWTNTVDRCGSTPRATSCANDTRVRRFSSAGSWSTVMACRSTTQ